MATRETKMEVARIDDLMKNHAYEEAMQSANNYLIDFPGDLRISCMIARMKADVGDWEGYSDLCNYIANSFTQILHGSPVPPKSIITDIGNFTLMLHAGFDDDLMKELTRSCWPTNDELVENASTPYYSTLSRKAKEAVKKFKIGYMSSWLRNHALAHLIGSIPASHNHHKFTVSVIDTAPFGSKEDMGELDIFLRSMIEDGANSFYDVGGKTASAMATAISRMHCHVLIALDGLMANNALPMLEFGPAPVTCTLLGFPCTTGCPFVNYYICDDIVCPLNTARSAFSEKLAYLPLCCYIGSHYEVHSHMRYVFRAETEKGEIFVMSSVYPTPSILKTKQGIAACWDFVNKTNNDGSMIFAGHIVYDGSFENHPILPTDVSDGVTITAKFHYDLPAEGVIFGSFNSTWKIDAKICDLWKKILKTVPKSVLWLIVDQPLEDLAVHNLETFFGQDLLERLIFSNFVSVGEHIRRGSLIDVHLDTYVCNGHTTTLDAIWGGGLVLTCPGNQFHTRVTSSILTALQMPCLLADSLDEYIEIAIYLGTHPNSVRFLQNEIQERKLSGAVYDPKQFSFDLEDICEQMYENWKKNPDTPAIWDEIYARQDGNELKVFKTLDFVTLQLLDETANASLSSAPQPKKQIGYDRINLFYKRPQSAAQEESKIFIGQASINVAWIESAGHLILEAMLHDYENLNFGPIMSVDFIDRLQKYMSIGIPKFPSDPTDFSTFFKSQNVFQHLNSKQFMWMSTQMNPDGIMVIPPSTKWSGISSADRKKLANCPECDYGRNKSIQISTILDKHVPESHVWRNDVKCSNCGISSTLFKSTTDFQIHLQQHETMPSLYEDTWPLSNLENREGTMRVHHFIPILLGENVLTREVQRYNNAASDATLNGGLGRWRFQPGQKMLTYLWMKEGFLRTISWMKQNTHVVAASGYVGYQFLHLFQLNLSVPGCPMLPNLGNMTPEIRKKYARQFIKFQHRESYELLMRIFDKHGKVDDHYENWIKRSSTDGNKPFCKLCHCELTERSKDIHQELTKNHIQEKSGPVCDFCNLEFGAQFCDHMIELRKMHTDEHAKIDGWKETVWDMQQGEGSATKIEYDVKFHA